MKHIHFDPEPNGFYGAYWPCQGADCAVIAMLGDDPEDHMARSAVKWLLGQGVSVLTMSPAKKDYSHHNYPLEHVEAAIAWLTAHGNRKVGIAGASTTGTLALTAAAYFPALTLTIAMTASDFVWQGFAQGDRDGCKEWPIPGESLFSYQGKPLPTCPSIISSAWAGTVNSWSRTWPRFFRSRNRPCGSGWRTITCCKNFRILFSKMRTEKERCYGKTKSQDPSLPSLYHGAYRGCSNGSGPVPVPSVRHAGRGVCRPYRQMPQVQRSDRDRRIPLPRRFRCHRQANPRRGTDREITTM